MNGQSYNYKEDKDIKTLSVLVNLTEKELSSVIERTISNKEKAYCPYSKFRVGCVLLTKNKEYIDGVNVENISYGLSICSERSALCSAISQGYKMNDINLLAVTTDREEFLTPCGACRQFISEFKEIKNIMIINNSGLIKLTSISELLPFGFETNL